MDRQLIIGIDLANEYCQASYYNWHHERPESVMTGAAVLRYLIPADMCYDSDNSRWLIGEEAMLYSEKTGTFLFRKLLPGMLSGEVCNINGEKKGYDTLIAIYLGRLLEMIQIHSGLMNIAGITITTRSVSRDVKEKLEGALKLLDIPSEKIRLISYADSFAYYVMNEDEALWKDGALLYDFDSDGFYSKQMTVAGSTKRPLVYVNEKNHSMEFVIRDLASEMMRQELDGRLSALFDDVKFSGNKCSVFFTGTGFSELWFSQTLEKISEKCRVFKGNNLYVKGACLAGYLREMKDGQDYPIVCRGRTRASVAIKTYYHGAPCELELSPAACNWYDAGSENEFVITGEKSTRFIITSLVSQQRTEVDFDLSSFPDRPDKNTRVRVSVRYLNEAECEIRIEDMGFGSLYAPSGADAAKVINLEGYI